MSRYKIFMDWFCCAGVGAEGYWRALAQHGYTIVGVDKDPQPNYPYDFIEADALTVMDILLAGHRALTSQGRFRTVGLDDIVANHGSPPCQLFCRYRNVKKVKASTDANYLNLIPDTRQRFKAMGKPYIIENVEDAKDELNNPIKLCGTSFDTPVRRHRLFELGNWTITDVPPCDHGRFTERRFPGSSNRPNGRTVCNIGEWRVPLHTQKECMLIAPEREIKMEEISEGIPSVMTEYLGVQLHRYLMERP